MTSKYFSCDLYSLQSPSWKKKSSQEFLALFALQLEHLFKLRVCFKYIFSLPGNFLTKLMCLCEEDIK